jgi:hypothetical protein
MAAARFPPHLITDNGVILLISKFLLLPVLL